MMRLGTFGFRDMKDLIGALNRYVLAPLPAELHQ